MLSAIDCVTYWFLISHSPSISRSLPPPSLSLPSPSPSLSLPHSRSLPPPSLSLSSWLACCSFSQIAVKVVFSWSVSACQWMINEWMSLVFLFYNWHVFGGWIFNTSFDFCDPISSCTEFIDFLINFCSRLYHSCLFLGFSNSDEKDEQLWFIVCTPAWGVLIP